VSNLLNFYLPVPQKVEIRNCRDRLLAFLIYVMVGSLLLADLKEELKPTMIKMVKT
jgi:hypothetical protein